MFDLYFDFFAHDNLYLTCRVVNIGWKSIASIYRLYVDSISIGFDIADTFHVQTIDVVKTIFFDAKIIDADTALHMD